ncbi:unnamed protein product [Cyclocybe aegerita]|uniref:CCHC-type domain-containing protein n=1 Tax=Cyclocybe aegerita TaxID=1973307 RepID=A0A8S0WTZ5_CYCAE|nr:unnamed protein product [Cyclocybe aegerita]
MSTRAPYALHTRRGHGAAPAAAAAPIPARATHDVPPHLEGTPLGYATDVEARASRSNSEAGARRSYSDVVTSRPPSPIHSGRVEETPLLSAPPLTGGPEVGENVVDPNTTVDPTNHERSSESESSDDENPNLWIEVSGKRKKRKSKKSAHRKHSRGSRTQDHEHLNHRYKNIWQDLPAGRYRSTSSSSESSWGEGPLHSKGKAVDPREWGGLRMDSTERDPALQRALLDSMRTPRGRSVVIVPQPTASNTQSASAHQSAKMSKQRAPWAWRNHTKKSGGLGKGQLPAEACPAAQIPARSYLGVTLSRVEKMDACKQKHRCSPPSSSPSSDSSTNSGSLLETSSGSDTDSPSGGSSSSSPSEDPSSSSESGSLSSSNSNRRQHRKHRGRHKHRSAHRQRGHQHSRRSHQSCQKRSRSSRGTAKAFKPQMYDGTPDNNAYQHFVQESSAYLEDAGIEPERYAFTLSCYMKDRAYDFYTQKVSMNEEEWKLKDFYVELFNFCFPINYRLEMRKKLDQTKQYGKSVVEFTHDLEELFNTIGEVGEREQVLKLWFGLRKDIQSELWMSGLHPDTSSWDEVRARAEVVEIAMNVSSTTRNRGQSMPTSRQHENRNSSRVTFTPNSSHSSRRPHHSCCDHGRTDRFPRHRAPQPANPGNNQDYRSSQIALMNNRAIYPGAQSGSRRDRPRDCPRDRHQDGKATNQLSERGVAERRAGNWCFQCNEVGHWERNCPQGKTVQSGSNRPPGVPNYNINVQDTGNDSEQPVEVLESMPLGYFDFEPARPSAEPWEIWEVPEPDWINGALSAPRSQIRDVYAMVAEYVLGQMQPYPEDDRFWFVALQMDLAQWFSVARVGHPGCGEYQIVDHLTQFDVKILKELLKRL